VLSLIKAHALLHRESRKRDENGRIVATLEDYGKVRGLAYEFISESVGTTVSEAIRESVTAVKTIAEFEQNITVRLVSEKLCLDKSAASRRIRKAIAGGYLRNLETNKHKPMKLELGDPLPEQVELLPRVEDLEARFRGCTVAPETEGVYTPLPPQGSEESPFLFCKPYGRRLGVEVCDFHRERNDPKCKRCEHHLGKVEVAGKGLKYNEKKSPATTLQPEI
jgi:hypothetical protein